NATALGAGAAAAGASPTRVPAVTASSPGADCGGGGRDGSHGSDGWVTCRYFMHGVCKDGGNCGYSHDLSDSPYGVVCKYFQQGECVYGDHCRYEHSKPLKQEEATATERTTKSSLAASSSLSSIGEMNTRAGSEDWVNAIEFVPGQPYCGLTGPSCTEAPLQGPVTKEESEEKQIALETKKQLCPHAVVGEYSCDMCGPQVLHPVDATQRSQHVKSCIEAHEKDIDKDMVCGICMEVVYEKANPSERCFVILSICNHTYCLKCICTWRRAKQFESKIVKSCLECQITSNFVIPSEYWVEEKEEKQKLFRNTKRQ
uniref:RING-type E3 ubiquitin transferase n=1 Tax=Colobus angolensis palliatus TaxID=336983 RepID=A0A2K5HWR2_COLAP